MFVDYVFIAIPRTTSEYETDKREHIHEEKHQFIFAHNSIGSITINDKEYPFKANAVYYAPKGVEHTCNNKIGTEYSIIFFTVKDPDLEKELKTLSYEIQSSNLAFIKILVWQMHMYKYSNNPISKFYLFSCFTMLLTAIMNKAFYMPIINNENYIMPHNPTSYIMLNNSFEKLLEFIKSFYTVDIPIERMIKVSGYQRAQLFRLFKEKLNTTPHNYVNSFRIEASKSMLADYNISITNIALTVGFKSAAVFTRLFSKTVGCSPSEYRKRIKNNNLMSDS